jgi:hypothetical protein
LRWREAVVILKRCLVGRLEVRESLRNALQTRVYTKPIT